jgi:hypothetical protein
MKSLRLDPELTERLERAAAVTDESLSQFIRTPAAARADTVLAGDGRADWSDVIGIVHGGGGQARRTGAAFTTFVAETKQSENGRHLVGVGADHESVVGAVCRSRER